MIDKYIYKKYINNSSDIKSFSNDLEFKNIIKILNENKHIKVTSNLIHKENQINQIEQFIFNLDNYITYIKQKIFINQLELKYIINLTLYNQYNTFLYSNLYYYENVNKYHILFQKIFMHNYIKNMKILNMKIKTFDELCHIINTNKKRTYCYFENITNNNKFFYKTIIESIEN